MRRRNSGIRARQDAHQRGPEARAEAPTSKTDELDFLEAGNAGSRGRRPAFSFRRRLTPPTERVAGDTSPAKKEEEAKLDSATIRERFISFFEEKGHTRMPSWPLILKDDPSVLFTSAVMQPLVPYLLGNKQPPAKLIVAVQKVCRATDIDEAWKVALHQILFEMLGYIS